MHGSIDAWSGTSPHLAALCAHDVLCAVLHRRSHPWRRLLGAERSRSPCPGGAVVAWLLPRGAHQPFKGTLKARLSG